MSSRTRRRRLMDREMGKTRRDNEKMRANKSRLRQERAEGVRSATLILAYAALDRHNFEKLRR